MNFVIVSDVGVQDREAAIATAKKRVDVMNMDMRKQEEYFKTPEFDRTTLDVHIAHISLAVDQEDRKHIESESLARGEMCLQKDGRFAHSVDCFRKVAADGDFH